MSVPTVPTRTEAEPLDSGELEINAPLVESIGQAPDAEVAPKARIQFASRTTGSRSFP